MTSPNEPGAPRLGDGLNGDGSVERGGIHRAGIGASRVPGQPDMPPSQRGTTRIPHPARHPSPDPHAESRVPGSPGGTDARLNRFIAGASGSASGQPPQVMTPQPAESDNLPIGTDGSSPEAYASELPDLSGPMPRATQRKPVLDRSSEGSWVSVQSRSAVPEPRETRVQVSRRARGGPVRASMQIRRIDPWTTLKVSLMLSVVLFFVWMIAVAFLYLVLGGMGVWAKLNSNVGDLLNNASGSSGELVSSGAIFGGAALIGLVNIVLMTAMATLTAFVYNSATDLIGGIEVTLADRD